MTTQGDEMPRNWFDSEAAAVVVDHEARTETKGPERQRRVFLTADLPNAIVAAIAASRMDPRHDHLNALLDDQSPEHAALKDDIEAGLADVAAGRVADFDLARIVERGKKRLE